MGTAAAIIIAPVVTTNHRFERSAMKGFRAAGDGSININRRARTELEELEGSARKS
jgi:hypothetical protein